MTTPWSQNRTGTSWSYNTQDQIYLKNTFLAIDRKMITLKAIKINKNSNYQISYNKIFSEERNHHKSSNNFERFLAISKSLEIKNRIKTF